MEFFVVMVSLRMVIKSYTKVNIWMGWKMEKELYMQTMQLIKEHLKMIFLKEKEK